MSKYIFIVRTRGGFEYVQVNGRETVEDVVIRAAATAGLQPTEIDLYITRKPQDPVRARSDRLAAAGDAREGREAAGDSRVNPPGCGQPTLILCIYFCCCLV
ncbi:hypothetical protein M3Y99_01196500 [Aphelenchoides fujianensis]|nr:hypothetical protein M3Y99_01196500 [Aphelenchoides fujianensis]